MKRVVCLIAFLMYYIALSSSCSSYEKHNNSVFVLQPEKASQTTEENTAEPPAKYHQSNTGYIRISSGLFDVSFDKEKSVEANTKLLPEYRKISEKDTFGDLTVKKIIAQYSDENESLENLDYEQILFSGSVDIDGILYRENGNSDVFSDTLEKGTVLFFPNVNGFENKLPLSPESNDLRLTHFTDNSLNFSISADTEPLLIEGSQIPDECFDNGDYVKVKVTLSDFQIRYNLNWLSIPYESVAQITFWEKI